MSDTQKEADLPITNPKYKIYEEVSNTYLLKDLIAFVKESTGLSLTIAYLILILSSMAYLYILYDEFNFSIVKYITLEDILATPIKNPNIILVFLGISTVFILGDISARFGARLHLKYAKEKTPLWLHMLKPFFWVPSNKNTNLRWTIILIFLFLSAYIIFFAGTEADSIKEGKGEKVMLQLADESEARLVTLLGTSSQFVFIYRHETEESSAFHVESVQSITSVSTSETDN